MYSVQEIKELIEWVSKQKVRGVEVERSGFRLKIEGAQPPEQAGVSSAHAPTIIAHAQNPAVNASAVPAAAAPTSAASDDASGAATPPPVPAVEEGLHQIASPIVGTFYRAPAPDKDPFVRQGERVTKGQVLCIVEAMKLMNEIEADVAGEIVKIHAQNAQPVEYGEKLFAIRPD